MTPTTDAPPTGIVSETAPPSGLVRRKQPSPSPLCVCAVPNLPGNHSSAHCASSHCQIHLTTSTLSLHESRAAPARGTTRGRSAESRRLPVLGPRKQLLGVLLQEVEQQRRVVRHQVQLALRHPHLQQDRRQQGWGGGEGSVAREGEGEGICDMQRQ